MQKQIALRNCSASRYMLIFRSSSTSKETNIFFPLHLSSTCKDFWEVWYKLYIVVISEIEFSGAEAIIAMKFDDSHQGQMDMNKN